MVTLFIVLLIFHTAFGQNSRIFQNYLEGVPDQCKNSKTENPFIKIGEKFYHVELKGTANFMTAAHKCKKLNANLASIESEQEMSAIYKHLDSLGYSSDIWISGSDLSKAGEYQWFGSGNDFKYTNWTPGQPDRLGWEQCVHIWKRNNIWGWNNMICSNEVNYLCQANDPQTVTTTIW